MTVRASTRDFDFAGQYEVVAKAISQSRIGDAVAAVRGISGSVIPGGAKRKTIPPHTQVGVFQRDGFNCLYCGRRVVLAAMLRLLAEYFAPIDPHLFPYHPHWKMTKCHLAFWRDSASCDHLLPAARGGNSDPDNLVTSCYNCNSIKQNWTLEELGWSRLQGAPQPWDGLSSSYPSLVTVVWKGSEPSAYHRRWLAALANV